jgi:hypothetical protein
MKKNEMSHGRVLIATGLLLAVLLGGCATNAKLPSGDRNPPPTESFSNFSDFELKPIDRGPDCVQERGADVAIKLVQVKLQAKIGKLIENWKESPAQNATGRKLIIEPYCENARYVGTGARLGLGFFSGDSVVVLNLRYVDASSGKVIASPMFYQKTNVLSGTYSWGATDRDMLERIASMIAIYTASNYEKAVGGPTGLEVQN